MRLDHIHAQLLQAREICELSRKHLRTIRRKLFSNHVLLRHAMNHVMAGIPEFPNDRAPVIDWSSPKHLDGPKSFPMFGGQLVPRLHLELEGECDGVPSDQMATPRSEVIAAAPAASDDPSA